MKTLIKLLKPKLQPIAFAVQLKESNMEIEFKVYKSLPQNFISTAEGLRILE